MKDWNEVSFGDLKKKKKNILTNIVSFDAMEQEGNLTIELSARRALRKGKLEELLFEEEVFWRKKARVKWIREGDCNSKFFKRWPMVGGIGNL